ncbi:RHS repeat-associated core domain-containing protein, partial [Pseudoduganella violaceinigra]|uniref:RHS repeat-associated core domain-containing protein n=1 Tax=Pseudoduganella violaceinigra TaxID=246602 RepID=UPI00137819F5
FTGHVNDTNTGLVQMQQRYYDPVAGRFLSIDQVMTDANSGSSFNRYVYTDNSPYKYVDPDGREIVAAVPSERTKLAGYLNSKASGSFKFDKNGQLMQTSGSGKGKSSYFSEQLAKGIASPERITLEISSYVTANGLKGVDWDFGGGVTMKNAGSNEVRVVISGNPNNNLTDTNGKPLTDNPADILVHEIVGHALPLIGISDTGNAVDNENKVRAQNGNGAQRAPEPNHAEK